MSKLRLLVMAMVTCLAVGSVAIAAAKPNHHKPKKVKVTSKVKGLDYTGGQAPTTFDPYQPYNPYDPDGTKATLTGKVKAKKGCARRRSISASDGLGQTSTSKDGQFSFTFPGNSASPGEYKVRVKGKKFTKGSGKHKKKIKCKPASNTLTLANLGS